MLIVAEAAFLLLSWGVSQFPYLIPPAVTAENASSPHTTQVLLLVGIILALIIVLPSLWLLYYVFKLKKVAQVAPKRLFHDFGEKLNKEGERVA